MNIHLQPYWIHIQLKIPHKSIQLSLVIKYGEQSQQDLLYALSNCFDGAIVLFLLFITKKYAQFLV